MKRKILALLLTALLLLSLSVSAFADTPVSSARNGVAVLLTWEKSDDYSDWLSYGSCFFIGKEGENPQYLLTNHHVIEDYLRYGAGSTETFSIDGRTVTAKLVLRVYYGANDFEEAYVVAYDQSQDIALLRLDKPTSKRTALPLKEVKQDMVGDTVSAIGYPSYVELTDSTSRWDVSDSLVTSGSISRLSTESGTGSQWIQIAATEWGGGNSGGPVVTSDGAVVGMVSHSLSDYENTIWMAVNVTSVLPMLRNNGVEFDMYSDKATTTKPAETTPATPKPATTPSGASPAVTPSESTPAVTPSESTPGPDAKTGFQLEPWMIAAGVGALVLLILLIALLSRKKPAAAPAPAPASETPSKSGQGNEKKKTAYIRSLAAQHGGMRVKLTDKPINIGRQDGCVIRFQPNTPGVSGVHCSISYDEGTNAFILTDLKSSYGTFLETGQKLAPHTPTRLRSGDSFYAGDRRNIFRVETVEE